MLTTLIPVFPLPDVVLFPGVFLPLHIFESRYREMVKDSLAGDRLIGVSLLRPGGVLLLQGEDAGALVAGGVTVRTRLVGDAEAHVRLFAPVGRRVRMFAGVAPLGGDAVLEQVELGPTSPRDVARMARSLGLDEVALPLAPPSSAAATWWFAATARASGS